MENVKHSPLYKLLTQLTRYGINPTDGSFTAEKYILCIISRVENEDGATYLIDDEYRALKRVLFSRITDVFELKEYLLHNMTEESNSRSCKYMNDILLKVTNEAMLYDKAEITSVDVLLAIVNNPPNTFKRYVLSEDMKTDFDKFDLDELLELLGEVKAAEAKLNELSGKVELEDEEDSDNEDEEDLKLEDEEDLDDEEELDLSFLHNMSNKSRISDLIRKSKEIRTELQNAVMGQNNAINVFVTGYFRASLLALTTQTRKRPFSTFLFAGPPGVGKTFLAETAAETLGLPFMRFDMSEYSDDEANIEFCGSDKVYKHGKAGNVTSFVSENPRCVLLFDEIEKAHISVIHLFLQILDAGRLRDNFTDEEVSFSDAIIILTTNAGKQLYEESESNDLSIVSRKVVINALKKDANPETGIPYFPSAICSRFASGNVVMFNHIEAHDLRMIAKNEIKRHAAGLEQTTGITVDIDDNVYTAILLSEGGNADARTIKSRAESFFNNELYEFLRLISIDIEKKNLYDLEKIHISTDITNADADIYELFYASEKTNVLVFSNKENVIVCQSEVPDFNIYGAQTLDTAIEIMRNHDIDFVMIDMNCGVYTDKSTTLHIEDVESSARELFIFLRDNKHEIPVYLITENKGDINEEEMISFHKQGVRDIICMYDDETLLTIQLNEIAEKLHQQKSIIKLSRDNKLVSFETAQTFVPEERCGEIRLYDFKTILAVDSEDTKNIMSSISKPNVHFEDVIGAQEAKKELSYFVEYLRSPKKYIGTGVKPPRGVLLYGPPGTGKTMLAKAMACESGVTFIATEGNRFLKKHVGEGSEEVHNLFKTARKYAPSILFIDEIDVIARNRRGASGNSEASEDTLTALLTEMDGFTKDASKPVFVLAATNYDVEQGRAKSLDPAIIRRFDRRLYINLPDKEERKKFLNLLISGNRALDISEEKIDNIAARANGMSLAELDSAVELALRSAIREGSVKVTDAILEEAFESFNEGERKKWDSSQLMRVARHEAGHAFLCWNSGETPSYLTIVARGDHGGYMQHNEQEGKAIYTRDELLDKMRTSLGGRAAEIVYYGEKDGISTSASGDLSSATKLAKQMVCVYGMEEDNGLAVIGEEELSNGQVMLEVRASVNRILQEQMNEAIRLISENKDKVDSLVEALMDKNHMTGNEIEAVLSNQNE